MVRAVLVALVALLPNLACRGLGGLCDSDSDCPGATLCVAGSCEGVAPEPEAPEDLDDAAASSADAGASLDAGWLDDGRAHDAGS